MSKLTSRSRKEVPTVKVSQPKPVPQIRRRLSGSDLDDDEIFIVKPNKRAPIKSESSGTASLSTTGEEPQAGSSRNPKPKKRSRSRSRTRSVSPIKFEESCQEQQPLVHTNMELPPEEEPEVPVLPDVELKDKVHCPFCWKKLHDKLGGMAHVKSCGKNLPTERIFDALQLQEKQVREWAELGISYPGFHNPNTRTEKPARGARARKKKPDAELELALALSESLHEEIENRKRTSDEYLIKIGLEQEVLPKTNIPVPVLFPPAPKPQPPSSFRVRFGNKAKPKLTKTVSSAIDAPRTRKGKTKLTETRLFTVTEEERQMIISEKVGQILEESENENCIEKLKYKLNEVEIPLGVSSWLSANRDKSCRLWNMASSDITPKIESGFTNTTKLPTIQLKEEPAATSHQGCDPMDNSTQTIQRKLVNKSTQTDPKDLVDNSVQTDKPSLADGSAQTEQQTQAFESVRIQTSDVVADFITPRQNDDNLPRDNFEWDDNNSDSDDSVCFIGSTTVNSLNAETEDRLEFCRSPSLSFGRSSSPEPEDEPPPSTVKIENRTSITRMSVSNDTSTLLNSPVVTNLHVTPPRRSLTHEFSRTVHRTPVPNYNSVDLPNQADNFDWGNDDSVFIQVPDHMFLVDKPEPHASAKCSSGSSSSSQFFSLSPEKNTTPENSRKSSNDVSQSELPAKGSQSKELKENSKSKDRHGYRLSSSQPAIPTTSSFGIVTRSPMNSSRLNQISSEIGSKDAVNSSPFGGEYSGSRRNVSPSSYLEPSPIHVHSDNFEWGNDDSIFNQIPDIMDEDMPEYYPAAESPPRSPSPISKPKRKAKLSKEKPANATAKIKLPKKLGPSKKTASDSQSKNRSRSATSTYSQVENETYNSSVTPPNPGRSFFSQGNNPVNPDHTPMLNYSCIDTPILKAELKKYGLKPLPRSKAKKILRHIYTETHK